MVRVIDTSIAIKWFVEEPGREAALGVLSKMAQAPSHFAVPELFYFELVHVLGRLLKELSEGQKKLLQRIFDLGIHRFPMTEELCETIRPLQAIGLSGYDAAYVGVAKILKGKWLTFDKKAHLRVKPMGLSELL